VRECDSSLDNVWVGDWFALIPAYVVVGQMIGILRGVEHFVEGSSFPDTTLIELMFRKSSLFPQFKS
jgi:hypothetical protein